MKKRVAITGGSRGIGRATVKKFVEEGYDVVFSYTKNSSSAENLLDELKEFSSRIYIHQLSLEDEKSIQNFLSFVQEKLGGLDVLVNNAGVNIKHDPLQYKDDVFNNLFHINVRGLYQTSLEAYKIMVKNNASDGIRGRIINVSAIPGRTTPPPGMVLYGASKASVDSLIKSLAVEFGKEGIIVNGIAPGITETDIISHDKPEVKKMLADKSVLKRLGRPADMASAIHYLSMDKWIVGQCINVSGGRLI